MKYPLSLLLILSLAAGCKGPTPPPPPPVDAAKPQRQLKEYFDKKLLLYKLADDVYKGAAPAQSFKSDKPDLIMADGVKVSFKPLGYSPALNLQYTHVYSDKCVYHTNDSMFKYAEVCFPNTCLTNDLAYAQAILSNTSNEKKHVFLRLFYQNTSYWYRTDDSVDMSHSGYLDNFYGESQIVSIVLPAHKDTSVLVPYSIGLDPKWEFAYDPHKGTTRPGNYEYMLLAANDTNSSLLKTGYDLQKNNPFVGIRNDKKLSVDHNTTYVGAHHFKFVFLDEYFDGVNDLHPNHLYVVKNGWEKKLCDTCTGWYKEVISEEWKADDFYKGFIAKAPMVKADYGIKDYNTKINSDGIDITIQGSRPGYYKKTWGEVLFGPSFKYGHVTIRAKLAPMYGSKGSPNGIIHNIWLYQRDPDSVNKADPYHYLVNGNGKQPYEIDFEMWSSREGINTQWDDSAFIYYSIVDYMRDAKVQLKPGETKVFGKYKTDRELPRQAGVSGKPLGWDFFTKFHNFDLYWYPDHVRYLIDGEEVAVLTKDMARIPDKYMFLWIGSPLYQDGTFYTQSFIPFLKEDKHTIVDYIRIE